MGIGAGAAAGIAAGVSAAGSVAGAAINSSSAAAGSKAQQTATTEALQSQNAQFAYSQKQLLPYIGAGEVAQQGQNSLIGQYVPQLNQLQANMVGLGSSETAQAALQQTPGYQFALNQGLRATANAAAARGLGVSGAALKGAADFATGLADKTYQNQYANASNNLTQARGVFQDLFGDYGSQASLGENAGVGAGSQGQAASTNTGNLLTSQGNAQAASSIAQGNALSGGISGVGNALTGYNNNQMLQKYLDSSGSQYSPTAGGGTGWGSATNGNSLTGDGF